jgi:hypothetical protein
MLTGMCRQKEDAVTSKHINHVGDYMLDANLELENAGLNRSADMAMGRFDCWLEKTACNHHLVVAQASALMRVHQRISTNDCAMNRRTH